MGRSHQFAVMIHLLCWCVSEHEINLEVLVDSRNLHKLRVSHIAISEKKFSHAKMPSKGTETPSDAYYLRNIHQF